MVTASDFIQDNAKGCAIAPACKPFIWAVKAEHKEGKANFGYIARQTVTPINTKHQDLSLLHAKWHFHL